MIGYFLYGLTFIAYILLISFNNQSSDSGGSDAAYGAALANLVVWAILAAFIVGSLLITINIAIQRGFDWISATATIRNIGIAVIWMGTMAGVAHCTTGRVDYTKDYELTATVRLLSQVIYYGAIWLPLFMLVPYFLLLKPEWQDTLFPNLFKIPLIVAPVLGILLFMSPKIMKNNVLKSYRALDRDEWAFNDAMERMEKNPSVGHLLYYTTKDNDKQLRSIALAKIKSNKNLDTELIKVLEQYDAFTCLQVYGFLDKNKVQHPEQFTEPIIKSFDKIISETHEGIVSPYKGGPFDVEVMLRVLEGQFKDSAALFKPSILKLQEVMETPPAKTRHHDDPEKCNETLYKNREGIKNWLAKH